MNTKVPTTTEKPAKAALEAHCKQKKELLHKAAKIDESISRLESELAHAAVPLPDKGPLEKRKAGLLGRKALGEDVSAELSTVDKELSSMEKEIEKGKTAIASREKMVAENRMALEGLTTAKQETSAALAELQGQEKEVVKSYLMEVAAERIAIYEKCVAALWSEYKELCAIEATLKDSQRGINFSGIGVFNTAMRIPETFPCHRDDAVIRGDDILNNIENKKWIARIDAIKDDLRTMGVDIFTSRPAPTPEPVAKPEGGKKATSPDMVHFALNSLPQLVVHEVHPPVSQ